MSYSSLAYVLKKYSTICWKNHKFYFPAKIFYSLLQSSVYIIRLFFVKCFIDSIAEKQNIKIAMLLLLLFLIFNLLQELLSAVFTLYIKRTQNDIQNDLQLDIIVKTFSLDIENYDNTEFHDKRTRAIEYATNGANRIIDALFDFISNLLTFAGSVYIISSLNVYVLIFLIIFTCIDFVVNKKRDELMYKLKKETTRINRKKNYTIGLLSNKSAMKDLLLNDSLEFILQRFKSIYSMARGLMINVDKQVERLRVPVRILNVFFSCIVYLFVGYSLFLKVITIGDFSMLYGAAESLKTSVVLIGANVSNIRSMNMDAKMYEEYMNLKPLKRGLIKLNSDEGFTLEFNNVWFKYNGQKEWAIKGVSFKINQGEHILLVGENGAGKTTLVNLMLGFYTPQIGDIYINNRNLKDYDRRYLYKMISAVFQDYFIYAYSIYDNISLNLKYDEELLQNSIKNADLKKVIKKLPKGAESYLTHDLDENGVELSGGEKQKLAISRSYYKNSNFLILDEPSSALDPISEEFLLQQYKELTKGKTAILISHHLNNFYDADYILVMNNGTICEFGTHEQLIKNQGTYYELYMLQKTKFCRTEY